MDCSFLRFVGSLGELNVQTSGVDEVTISFLITLSLSLKTDLHVFVSDDWI